MSVTPGGMTYPIFVIEGGDVIVVKDERGLNRFERIDVERGDVLVFDSEGSPGR